MIDIKLKPLFCLILITSLLSCSGKTARVINRNKIVYNKQNILNSEKYKKNVKPQEVKFKADSNNVSDDKKNVSSYNSTNKEILVNQGDTLYSIARTHHVAVKDIINQNNIAAPYILKSGEKIIIPSQTYHEVKQGETLYAISRIYDMKVNKLIEINSLKEPYSVIVGQKIRVTQNDQIEQKKQEEKQEEKPIILAKNKEKDIKNISEKKFAEKNLDHVNRFIWPVKGNVISKFGPKSGGLYNDGINIKANEGVEVFSVEDGVVAYVGNELKGYGNLIIIKHSHGWITAYAHLKETFVNRGDSIKKGKKIASVGSTGNVTFSQLYFGLRKGRDAVNPENYLTK